MHRLTLDITHVSSAVEEQRVAVNSAESQKRVIARHEEIAVLTIDIHRGITQLFLRHRTQAPYTDSRNRYDYGCQEEVYRISIFHVAGCRLSVVGCRLLVWIAR